VPDAGPLISLAHGDALELLLLLQLPILLVDEIVQEVTAAREAPDAQRLRAFIADNRAVVRVAETFVGRSAAAERARDPAARLRGVGEAAIAEVVSRIDELVPVGEPILVLFEDSDVPRIQMLLRGNVHLLSTRAMLLGMERVGLIPSMDAVWQAIRAGGRRPATTIVDRPAPPGHAPSRWLP
jgi:hypothetical protein